MDNTRQNVVSQGKRREVSVRDVDRHEGKEVGDGKQEEGQQPFKKYIHAVVLLDSFGIFFLSTFVFIGNLLKLLEMSEYLLLALNDF